MVYVDFVIIPSRALMSSTESGQAANPQPPIEISKISEEEADNAANEAAGKLLLPLIKLQDGISRQFSQLLYIIHRL